MSSKTTPARAGHDRASLYDEITGKIIAELEAGRVPWVQPWGTAAAKAPLAMPRNAATGRQYSGINVLILWGAVIEHGFPAQSWLTFRQALSLGGNVRKGEHGTTVVYADRFVPDDEKRRARETGEEAAAIPFLKRFTVFNAAQCENLPAEIAAVAPPPLPDMIEPRVEALIRATGVDFRIGGARAFYAPGPDFVMVMVLERHRDAVVADCKSIVGIGYEERLHDYDDNGAPASIEGDLNEAIETPFSQSTTWLKIGGGNCASLDESDRLPLYGFARHLQLRNFETLRFIETQHARYLTGELEDELTDEERDMHAWIASGPGTAHELFRAGAMETMLPADAAGSMSSSAKHQSHFDPPLTPLFASRTRGGTRSSVRCSIRYGPGGLPWIATGARSSLPADRLALAPGLSRRTSPAWSIVNISSSSWRAARVTCWPTTTSLAKISNGQASLSRSRQRAASVIGKSPQPLDRRPSREPHAT
jgi:hypothetical protein